MANPKHSNPHRSDRKATAPYNFVPLPEKVVTVDPNKIPGHDTYAENTFTGYLDCALTTESPTYTRWATNFEFFQNWSDKMDKVNADQGAREEYAQFSLDDMERPVIPGSSLRGMTHALVEIAGYGKVQRVTKDRLFFRTMDNTAIGDHYRGRMGDKVEGGFLQRRGQAYYIKICQISRVSESVLGEKRYRLYRGSGPNKTPRWSNKPHQHEHVWVELSENGRLVKYLQFDPPSTGAQTNLLEGRLIITGDMKGKKNEFVFLLPEQNAGEVEVSDKIIERFHDDDQITRWQRNAFKKDEPHRSVRQRDGFLSRNLSGEGDPVFFLRENGELTFFGRAKMFRLPYTQSPFDLVPERLRQDTDTDLAEAIFGYIPKKTDTQGRAGRVYFSDARFEQAESDIWLPEGIITPQILSGPKPTTFQHYLVQDAGKGHNPDDKKTLAHYGTSPEEAVIRGHKLYWHQGPISGQDIRESNEPNWANDTQHTQIKPVNKGVAFRFKVHFENLRDYELGALLWVLDLPPDCRHKIGLGKPLGLGSVHITPRLVLSNRQTRYTGLFDNGGWAKGEKEENNLDRFKKVFEQFILDRMDENEKKSDFHQVERINMLLKMLKWPGPDGKWQGKKLTEYMTIEPNQFKERPVLPDPLHIHSLENKSTSKPAGPSGQLSGRRPTGLSGRQQPKAEAGQPVSPKPAQPASRPEPGVSRPISEAEVKEGMRLEGQVVRVESERVVLDIGIGVEVTLPKEKVVPSIQNEDELRTRFWQGDKIEVWVSGRNKKGRIQLTMQKPSS